MLVYRISRKIYANDLSGTGAALYGGRWNPRGISILYTAGSISLSCLEYLVHNYHIMNPKDICLSKIYIPKHDLIEEVSKKRLPNDWKQKSYEPLSTQQIGLDFFQRNESYILKVPSVVVPDEFNYLLNPLHPAHKKTTIKEQIIPFEIDSRLFNH